MKATILLILRNLDTAQRRGIWRVIFISFSAVMLELLTVASLYPLTSISLLGNVAGEISTNIPAYFGATTTQSIGLFWAGTTLMTVLVSLVVRLSALYIQTRFVHNVRHATSRRVFTTYLCQPYKFFLKHHSSKLAKNTLQEVDLYAVAGVNGLIGTAVSLTTIMATLCLMLLFSPVPTMICAFAAIFLYALFFLIVSRPHIRAARNRFDANRRRNFIVSESFAMFKEVKANNNEAYFVEAFEPASCNFSNSMIVFDLVANLPRYFIETVLFGGMAVIIGIAFLMMPQEVTLGQALPTIAVALGATARVLPALQSLYRNLNNLRNCAPTVQNLSAILALEADLSKTIHDVEALSFESDIAFDGVSFCHDAAKKNSLTDLTVSIRRGAHVGIVGETGSGKSTFLDLLMGLLEPSKGAILVDGIKLGPVERPRWRRNIGYVPQQVVLIDGTIAQNIALGIDENDIDLVRVTHVARIAQAIEFIDQLPDGLHSLVGERGVQLSGGQRQRLCIARALYQDPEVLIFDEATSALDHETERRVIDAIRDSAANRTLIMVAHRESTLAHCDQRITFVNGRC